MYRNGANGNGNGGAAGGAAGAEAEDTTATTGYSLEALSKELVPDQAKSASMKELFGVKRRVIFVMLWCLCGVYMCGVGGRAHDHTCASSYHPHQISPTTHIYNPRHNNKRIYYISPPPHSNILHTTHTPRTRPQQAHAHDHPHLTHDTLHTHTRHGHLVTAASARMGRRGTWSRSQSSGTCSATRRPGSSGSATRRWTPSKYIYLCEYIYVCIGAVWW